MTIHRLVASNQRIDVAGKKKGRTMNPLIQSKNETILPVLIALTLDCFALSPQARAACQQGCDTMSASREGQAPQEVGAVV